MPKEEEKEKNPWWKPREALLDSLQEFSVRANVVTVVEDSQLEKVIKTILDTISTGSAGDGKIFVSTVIDAIDIGTKTHGEEAIS